MYLMVVFGINFLMIEKDKARFLSKKYLTEG
jgi:hypothetical protein